MRKKTKNKEEDGPDPPPPHHLLHRTALVHNCTTKMIHISVGTKEEHPKIFDRLEYPWFDPLPPNSINHLMLTCSCIPSLCINGRIYLPENKELELFMCYAEKGQIILLEPVQLIYGLSVVVESNEEGGLTIWTSLWDIEQLATDDMKVTQMKDQRNKRMKK